MPLRYRTPLLSLDRALATLLDEAREGGEVRIKRRDGSEFTGRPVPAGGSPLDVPGVDTGLARAEIMAVMRDSRERG